MIRIKLIISYDGTDFCGWQRQAVHACASPLPSIQETLEKALERILCHQVCLSASGRTDSGVHALAQVAHFDTDSRIPHDICWALRAHLPPSIAVKAAYVVPAEFHATLSAEKKTYLYWIWNHQRDTALLKRYTWWIRQPLSIDALNQMAACFIGEHDFASFRSVGTPVKTTIRRVDQAQWSMKRPGLVQFEVTGNGFMKQMVRNLVGTQASLVMKGKSPEILRHILESRDRRKAGMAAPPQGLFLKKVYYSKNLDIRGRQI